MEERLSGHDFREAGWAFGEAWDSLIQGCEVPPSFEGFIHGYEQVCLERKTTFTPQEYARLLVRNYHRVPFPK